MRSHDEVGARLHRCCEGDELAGAQLVEILLHRRGSQMAVGARIPVAREMLEAGDRPRARNTFGHRASQLGDHRGVVSEGAHADDGVGGVAVDVGDRREVHVDAQDRQLPAQDRPRLAGVLLRGGPRRSDGHGSGHASSHVEAQHDASLAIGADEIGDVRACLSVEVVVLQRIGEAEGLRRPLDVRPEEDHAAELMPAQRLGELGMVVEVRGAPRYRRDDELGDLLIQAHAGKDGLDLGGYERVVDDDIGNAVPVSGWGGVLRAVSLRCGAAASRERRQHPRAERKGLPPCRHTVLIGLHHHLPCGRWNRHAAYEAYSS